MESAARWPVQIDLAVRADYLALRDGIDAGQRALSRCATRSAGRWSGMGISCSGCLDYLVDLGHSVGDGMQQRS